MVVPIVLPPGMYECSHRSRSLLALHQSVLSIIAVLLRHLIFISICVSLITEEVGYDFMFLLAIQISSFVKHLMIRDCFV